jgi:hypothetical protein
MIQRCTAVATWVGLELATLVVPARADTSLPELVAEVLPALPGLPGLSPLAYDAFDRRREEGTVAEPAVASDDGVYGRFQGEVQFTPYLGVEHAYRGFAPALGLRAHYLSTVGIHFTYASGALWPAGHAMQHHLSDVGAELRPLFLLRWPKGWEDGPSFLDLTVDSLTLGIGGFWDRPRDDGGIHRGPVLQVAAAVPLTSRALGPWIGGAAMWRFPHVAAHPDQADFAWMVRFEWTLSASSNSHPDS